MSRGRGALATSVVGVAFLLGPLPAQITGARPCPVSGGIRCEEAAREAGVRCQTEAGLREYAGVDSYCLSCHDGKAAPARLCAGVKPIPHSSTVAYPPERSGFRPASSLDGRLRLRAGRVTCETCHAGRDAANSYLSITVTGSALCLACHVK